MSGHADNGLFSLLEWLFESQKTCPQKWECLPKKSFSTIDQEAQIDGHNYGIYLLYQSIDLSVVGVNPVLLTGAFKISHNRFHLVVPMCSGGIVHHPVPDVPMPHPPHVHVWASLFVIRISSVCQIISLRINSVAPQTINVAQPCSN